MPKSGTFSDSDPSEVVDLLDRKIVNRTVLGSLVAGVSAVVVRPAGGDPSQPQAWIGRPGLLNRTPSVNVMAPDETAHDLERRLSAAGVSGAEPRRSFGQLTYDFPKGASAAEVLDFSLRALRALGVQSDRWEYETQAPEGA